MLKSVHIQWIHWSNLDTPLSAAEIQNRQHGSQTPGTSEATGSSRMMVSPSKTRGRTMSRHRTSPPLQMRPSSNRQRLNTLNVRTAQTTTWVCLKPRMAAPESPSGPLSVSVDSIFAGALERSWIRRRTAQSDGPYRIHLPRRLMPSILWFIHLVRLQTTIANAVFPVSTVSQPKRI